VSHSSTRFHGTARISKAIFFSATPLGAAEAVAAVDATQVSKTSQPTERVTLRVAIVYSSNAGQLEHRTRVPSSGKAKKLVGIQSIVFIRRT
jgi:hypothetical protein